MDTHSKIDQLFGDKLRQHQISPPPKVWKAIKANLPRKVPFYQTSTFWVAAAMTALIIGSWLGYSGYNKLPISNPTPAQTQNSDTPDSKTHSTTPPTNNDNSSYQASPDLPTIPNIQAEPPTRLPNKKATDRVAPLQYQPAAEDMPLSQRINNETIYETAADRINATTTATSNSISKGVHHYTMQNKVSTTTISSEQSQHDLATKAIASVVDATNKTTTTIPTTNNAFLATDQPNISNNPQIITPLSLRDIELDAQLANATLNTQTLLSKRALPAASAAAASPQKPQRQGIGLYAQAFGSYGGSRIWSSNAETERLHTTFGSNYGYGLALGYDFSPRWGIVAEYVAHNRQTQPIERTDANGNISQSTMRLTYTAVPVLAKIRLIGSRMTNKPSELNLLVGLQYARLQSAAINSDNAAYLNLLKTDHWGFAAGVEYDYYLNKHLSLTTGLRSSLQMPANGLFDLQLPSTTSTNNWSIGGKVGLGWHF